MILPQIHKAYKINFNTMTQTTEQSMRKREIRRIDL